jgi:hypothetical protein
MTDDATGHPPAPRGRRLLDRSVADIAGEIIDDYRWHERELPPAVDPFLEIMLGLGTRDLTDPYRSGRVADVVRGALAHLHDWHGPTAQRITHELRRALEWADRTDPGTTP